VSSAHGLLPIPAPATAALLAGVPVYTSQAKGELVTPTGAAILTTLANSFGPMPPMTVQAVGYGAGMRQREFPNVLRVFMGKLGTLRREPRDPYPEQHTASPGPSGYHDGPAVAIEANLDDMPPLLYENLLEKLLSAGALDVLLIPAQMKKARPGMLLHVLTQPDSVGRLLNVIFRESTTIGARTYPVTKHMLQREILVVQTPYGAARVKIARLGEQVVNVAPEYEDCVRLAEERGIPLKEALLAAQTAARERLDSSS
jgi:uncharacterized protein (TIGR00299 family) protein